MKGVSLLDGSALICMGALHAGVDFFAGYPITPSSGILTGMIRHGVGMETPDEITAMQYLVGASLTGRKSMTATSGPGYLLMSEGIGAAFAMEAPMVIVLVQRLGPSTGVATWNAQGDILMAEHVVSGGFTLPMLCPSSLAECAELTALSVNLAEALRVPVVVMTEKDMVASKRAVDLGAIQLPAPVERTVFVGNPDEYLPYGNWSDRGVPPFRPLGDAHVRVRATASIHNTNGDIAPLTDTVRENVSRLHLNGSQDLFPEALFEGEDGGIAVLSYGYSSYAAREAAAELRSQGQPVVTVIVRTLFPLLVESLAAELTGRGIQQLVVVEENRTGQYLHALRGAGMESAAGLSAMYGVNDEGRPIRPGRIIAAVKDAARAGGGRP